MPATAVDTPVAQGDRTGRRPPRRRWLAWPLLALVLVGLAGWLAHLGLQARHQLDLARADLETIQSEVDAGNALSTARIAAAASASRSADDAVRDPVWLVAARIPWLGDPLRTISGLAQVSDRLTHDTLPALVGAEQHLQQIKRGDATSSLDAVNLDSVAGTLSTADAQVAADLYAVTHLPSGRPVSAVSAARSKVAAELSHVGSRLHAAAVATRVAASMVGGSTTKTYLVLFENPSEARPDMGLVGGYSIITARSGTIRVARVGSNTDLPPNPGPSGAAGVVLTQGYAQLGAGSNWLSSNLSPDFSEDGALLAAMYRSATGQSIDGVAALDPVALGSILSGSNQSVTIPGAATLSGDQLPAFLESGQYRLRLDEGQRKDLLGEAGRQTMQTVLSSHPSVTALAKTLATLAADGHVRLYSSSPIVESELSGYRVGGALPSGPQPFLGTYVIDASARKLDYYLHESVSYRATSCAAGGQAADVSIRLTNAAPAGLPPFVSQGNVPVRGAAPPGYNTLYLSVVTAAGSRITSATVDGQPVVWALQSEESGDHPVSLVRLRIPPGGDTTVQLALSQPHTHGRPIFGTGALPQSPVFSVTGSCAN